MFYKPRVNTELFILALQVGVEGGVAEQPDLRETNVGRVSRLVESQQDGGYNLRLRKEHPDNREATRV